MQTRIIDALACCAAGLCAHSAVSRRKRHQTITDEGCPVRADVEVACSQPQDRVGHIDQPVGTCGTVSLLQAHPSCDACGGFETQEDMDQEVKEVVVEEDAASTVGADSPERLGDAASGDSEDSWAAASSPEVTLGPDRARLCQRQLAACSSLKPEVNVQTLPHVQPLASVSFKTDSDSKLTALEQSAASVAAAAAADGVAAELEATRLSATPVDVFSAQIVGQSGKFYTIDVYAAGQHNKDLVPVWILTKRYKEFSALDLELRQTHPGLPALPPKSVFFRRTFKRDFIDDRKNRLSAYLSALVADPSVFAEHSVQSFICGMAL